MTRRTFILLAAGLTLGAATPVRAHHILGLPHYEYKDNYPQAPVLEYPAQTGPYDVLLSAYPGRPVPGEPASVVVYIKDRETGAPYGTPVSLRVRTQGAFGEGREILPPTRRAPTTNQFKYTVTFPEAGEYIVELTVDVEGQVEVIPFLMVAGDPRAPATVPLLVAAGLALLVIAVRAVKIKRARRQSHRARAEAQPRAAWRRTP